MERREQEGREREKTEFRAPALPTASSENLNHDLSFLISLWKQDNSSCAANSIDLQDGSKEIEDLEKLWEVKTVFQNNNNIGVIWTRMAKPGNCLGAEFFFFSKSASWSWQTDIAQALYLDGSYVA